MASPPTGNAGGGRPVGDDDDGEGSHKGAVSTTTTTNNRNVAVRDASWEALDKALDAIGAPQTEAQFFAMFSTGGDRGALREGGPLDLPGLEDDADNNDNSASVVPPGVAEAPGGFGPGMFAAMAGAMASGADEAVVGSAQPAAPATATSADPRTPPRQSVPGVAQEPRRTAAPVPAADGLDDSDVIELPDDEPSPAGDATIERMLSGDASSSAVLFDNFTDGLDDPAGGAVSAVVRRDSKAAGSDDGVADDSGDDDGDGDADAPMLIAPGAGRIAVARGARCLLDATPSKDAAPTEGDGLSVDGACVDAGEPFSIDADFDYDIPASKLTRRFEVAERPPGVGDAVRDDRSAPLTSEEATEIDSELARNHDTVIADALAMAGRAAPSS